MAAVRGFAAASSSAATAVTIFDEEMAPRRGGGARDRALVFMPRRCRGNGPKRGETAAAASVDMGLGESA